MQAAALQKLLEGLNMSGVETTPQAIEETTKDEIKPLIPALSTEKEIVDTNRRDDAIRQSRIDQEQWVKNMMQNIEDEQLKIESEVPQQILE